MKNKSCFIGFILNLVVAALASVGLIIQLVQTPTIEIFKYYTILSNTLCIIISLTLSVFYGLNTFVKPVKIPKVISVIKYVDVVMLLVTFLTVVFFLSWTLHEKDTFFEQLVWLLSDGSMLYHHTLVPLISLISFIFYEKHNLKPFFMTFVPSLVTLVYGIIFLVLNATGVLKAPYPFLDTVEQPIYFCVLIIVAVLLIVYGGAFLIRLANKHWSTIKDE